MTDDELVLGIAGLGIAVLTWIVLFLTILPDAMYWNQDQESDRHQRRSH